MRNIFTLTLLLFASVSLASTTSAQEPGWEGTIVARGSQRAYYQSQPIVARPYRPLHFYGNTVRRRHYRGRVAPAPRDVFRGASALARRR